MRCLAVLLLLGAPAVARADAIMGPPEDCPRGARGESSHTDTYCAPSTCSSDLGCDGGVGTDALVCAPEVGLCIESRTRMPGGLWPEGVPRSPVTYDVATASCASDADCATGEHCVVTSRCARRTATEFVRHALGCSARRSGAASASLALSVLAIALVALRRHVVAGTT